MLYYTSGSAAGGSAAEIDAGGCAAEIDAGGCATGTIETCSGCAAEADDIWRLCR